MATLSEIRAAAVSASPSALAAFVRLGRPKFLLYSLLLYHLGCAVAVVLGVPLAAGRWLLGQVFVTCGHLMTHYCNEYFDLEADAAHPSPTRWTGGSRVLVDRLLPARVGLAAALVLLGVTLVLAAAMPTAATRALAFALIGLAWFYTAPPLRLNYRGFGEATVAVGLNLLTPTLACLLQMNEVPRLLWLVAAPIVVLQHARMLVMNLADHDGDIRVGKRTLAVRLGHAGAVRVFTLAQAVAYASLGPLMWAGLPAAVGLALLLTLPLSVWRTRRLRAGDIVDPRRANAVVYWASTHVALVAACAVGGLLFESARRAPLAGPWIVCAAVVALYFAIVGPQAWRNRT